MSEPDPAVADESAVEVGPYVLLRLLGEGGMGAVWLADQRHPIRRQVALKLLKRGLGATLVARFAVERQMLALLNHEHIARIFDAGLTADGRPFLAMEYVTGAHITAHSDRVRATIRQRLELFLQVCEAVQHAHQRGVIHRDLKPSNILVADVEGRASVKVIDFGIAKAVDASVDWIDGAPVTQLGTFLGTPDYMSPEQAGAIDAVIDTRTDIYSLGVVLYELLAGVVPFDLQELRRRGRPEMLRVLREDSPPRPSTKVSDPALDQRSLAERRQEEPRTLVRRLRGDLDWITGRALEKDPARRYPAVSELIADLRRHLRSEPVLARPPELRYRIGKFVRRHRVAVAGAAAVLLAIVAASVISSVSFVQAERARREARASLNAFHVAAGLRLADDGDDLRALPWLVRALALEEGGANAEAVHRMRLGHLLATVPLPVRTWTHAQLAGAAVSPDRRQLLTWDGANTAYVWDTSTGQAVGPPIRHPSAIVDARLGNDATVAVADTQGTIHVWDARTATRRYPAITHGPGLALVRMEGSRLLSADAAGGLKLWTEGVATPASLPRYEGRVEFAEFLGAGGWIATSGAGRFELTPTSPGLARAFGHPGALVAAGQRTPDTVITTDRLGRTSEWNLQTGAQTAAPSAVVANGAITSAWRAVDGLTVVCGLDGAVTIRSSTRQVSDRMDPGRSCADVDAAPDETLVATGHADGYVRVWSWFGQAISPRLPFTSALVAVTFLPDTRYVLGVDVNGVIRVWDLAPTARPPRAGLAYTWTSEFSRDGRRLAMASGTSDSTIPGGVGTIVDAATATPVMPQLRQAVNVRGIAFSPDGRLVATVAQNGAARFWDADTGEPVTDELPHQQGGLFVGFSPDGRLAWIQSDLAQGGAVTLRRVPGGELIARVPASGPALMPDISDDNRHVVLNEIDRLRVRRVADGAVVAEWTGYESGRFLDASTLVAVGRNGIARLALDGRALASQPTVSAGSSHIVLSADRSRAAWIVNDGRVEVWSTGPALVRLALTHISGTGLSVGLSPDGRFVAAASVARLARVWTVAGGHAVTPERRMRTTPLSVTFSPDSTRVQISGTGADVWRLEPDLRPLSRLQEMATWLAAHVIEGTSLVAVTPDRLTKDIGVRASAADESRWAAAAGTAAIQSRRWADAASAFAALTAAPGADWMAWAGLGTAMAEQGRWADAGGAFDRAAAQRPDSTELLFLSALARDAGGDIGAIAAHCREGLMRHHATRNEDRARWLARLCACAPALEAEDVLRVNELVRRTPVVGLDPAPGERPSAWYVPIEARLRRLRPIPPPG